MDAEGNKLVLKLLDYIMGGWPAIKSYSWIANDFSWTNVTVQARRYGVNHNFFLNIETYMLNNQSKFILSVSIIQKELP